MSNKYNIVLCELFHGKIHGLTNNSDKNIWTHFILSYKLDIFEIEEYDENNISIYETIYLNDNSINGDIGYLRHQYHNYYRTTALWIEHPIIRNFINIISRNNYIKPEIAQCIELETGETIVILKTFWLRIIQRKWKKYIAEIKRIQNIRKKISSLNQRQLTGKWPRNARYLPSIIGLFYSNF
jgi:hypothetical protein